MAESYAIWTSVTTFTTTELNTFTEYIHPSFTVPSPDCTVPITRSIPFSATGTSAPQSEQVDPALSYLSQQAPSTQCSNCTIIAKGVQLIYWPVVTVPGNPNLTVTQTGPLTGYFSGTPYVSGSVYLKYDNVNTEGGCGTADGPMISGSVVTLASDEVSSIVGDGTYFVDVESFINVNLNYPVCGQPTPPNKDVYTKPELSACSKHWAGIIHTSVYHQKSAALTHRGRPVLSTHC